MSPTSLSPSTFENTIFFGIFRKHPIFKNDLVYRRFKMGRIFSFKTGPEQPIRSQSYEFSFADRHIVERSRGVPKFHSMLVAEFQCFFLKDFFGKCFRNFQIFDKIVTVPMKFVTPSFLMNESVSFLQQTFAYVPQLPPLELALMANN